MVLPAILFSCNGFFGKKTNLDFLPVPDYSSKPISYVPILPEILGSPRFNNPIHVSTGFDNLVYVVDSALGIYSFDQSGRQLAFFPLPGVTFVIQDRNLDLLALVKFDTITNGTPQRLNAILRYDMKFDSTDFGTLLSLKHAKLVHRMVYPFFTRETQRLQVPDELKQINLNAIGILSGNRYYVTCSGPARQAFSYSFPNNCVLYCSDPAKETGVAGWSPIAVSAANGTYGTDYFKQPFGIATTIQPPQSLGLGNNPKDDFIFTSLDSNSQFRVQYMQAQVTGEGFINYSLKDLPVGDTAKATGFLYSTRKFITPLGLTIAGDNTHYIFVTDASKDSLYQFSIDGLEGVKPNAVSASKLVKVSFGSGKADNTATKFRNLRGVAYADRTVYLADAGNRRVVRFKLTTDFQ